MPRQARQIPGGLVYHVMNRGVARLNLFAKEADYQAFEQVLTEAMAQAPHPIARLLRDAQSLAYAALAPGGS